MPTVQELNTLLEGVFAFEDVKPSDLPDIDLYIDQILKIFEDKLSPTRRNEKEKLLTKAMVNNYSKEKLLTPIRGKTYSRFQVLELLTIFQLKNTLSMEDIRGVLDNLRQEVEPKSVLTRLLNQKERIPDTAQLASNTVDSLLPKEAPISQEELLGLLLSMNRMSCLYKRACEALVDQYFPPVSESRKKEREERI